MILTIEYAIPTQRWHEDIEIEVSDKFMPITEMDEDDEEWDEIWKELYEILLNMLPKDAEIVEVWYNTHLIFLKISRPFERWFF